MTLAQRRLLTRARRWSAQVPKAATKSDKRHAVNKVLICLRVLLAGTAPTEIERAAR